MYNLREFDDFDLYNSNNMLEVQDSYLYKTVAVIGIAMLCFSTFLFLKANEINKEEKKDETV
jgi:hypothetical protein